MAYGIATTGLANALLNTIKGTSFAAPATWIQLHTGDPGAAGTANLSAVTTRQQATFATASGGAIALASTPTPFNMTATETIGGVVIGHFLFGEAISGHALAHLFQVVGLAVLCVGIFVLGRSPFVAAGFRLVPGAGAHSRGRSAAC